MALILDPAAITLIQNVFLKNIASALDGITHIAKNLLYFFTAFEFVIFGLVWALSRSAAWERIFFKIIKIGLIFFIISNYSYFLDIILRSFAQIGAQIGHNVKITDFLFNPAKLWQYGYDPGIQLLQSAMRSSSIGLAITGTVLGLGIIIIFGLLGIQVILQYIGFYLVAITALITLPLGVFNPTSSMFDKSVQSVLKAGVRIMMLLIVLSLAITIWDAFNLDQNPAGSSINSILGLFFTGLVFLTLARYLPKLAEKAVGDISSNINEITSGGSAATGQASVQAITSQIMAAPSEIAAVRAASHIDSSPIGASTFSYGATGVASATSPASASGAQSINTAATPVSATGAAGAMGQKIDKISTADATSMSKDISANIVKDLHKTIMRSLDKEKFKK